MYRTHYPGPDPNRDPADSDLVSKKEYTEKYFFKNKPCVNEKKSFCTGG